MLLPYGLLKKIAIAVLAVYFFMGLVERGYRHGGELYPFFSWYLFALIPNPQPDAYELLLHSYDGTDYDPPLHFSQTRFIFEELRQSPTEYTTSINGMGGALFQGYPRLAVQHQERLEQMFGGKQATYEILHVEHDPVLYWRAGFHASSTSLGVFETDL